MFICYMINDLDQNSFIHSKRLEIDYFGWTNFWVDFPLIFWAISDEQYFLLQYYHVVGLQKERGNKVSVCSTCAIHAYNSTLCFFFFIANEKNDENERETKQMDLYDRAKNIVELNVYILVVWLTLNDVAAKPFYSHSTYNKLNELCTMKEN